MNVLLLTDYERNVHDTPISLPLIFRWPVEATGPACERRSQAGPNFGGDEMAYDHAKATKLEKMAFAIAEDDSVIAVWRGRTERAEAEIARLTAVNAKLNRAIEQSIRLISHLAKSTWPICDDDRNHLQAVECNFRALITEYYNRVM